MATKLKKDVIRESDVVVNGRNVIITLTKEQEISMKLKGMKTGEIKIKIEDLYNQIISSKEIKKDHAGPLKISRNDNKPPKNKTDTINLHDFRSRYLINGDFSYETKVQLEQITTSLIDQTE